MIGVIGEISIKKQRNKYKIVNNSVIIYVVQRNGRKHEILIDLEDFDKVKNYRWYVNYFKGSDSFYAKTTVYKGIVDGKFKYNIFNLSDLIIDRNDNEIVDHINHNTLDNRKENIRITTIPFNSKHRKSKNSNNKSGYRSVCWIKGKWVVQLQIDGKNTRLRSFDDVHEAGKFAEQMRQKYYKEFAGNG